MKEEMTLEELVKEHQESKWRYILALWEKLLPLIRYKARRRNEVIKGRYGNDVDDYIQEAFLVLVRCADIYDFQRKGFLKYFIKACSNRFSYIDGWDSDRKEHKSFMTVSLYEQVYEEDDETMLIDVLSSKFDMEESVINRVFVEEAIDQLPEPKRGVIRAFVFDNKSQKEIAEERGCSHQNISRMMYEAGKEIGRKYGKSRK